MVKDPVASWKDHAGYCEAKEIIDNLLVTNDTAERGIKMITDFNTSLVKDPNERQRLLQVVEYHRSKIPDAKKTTVKASYFIDFPI